VVPPGTRPEDCLFERGDIVLLQESYPDITPVAGIVSTVFSTPLSHVNLRAREWGIPNAGVRDAGTRYTALDGKQVFLEVKDVEHALRPATEAEIAEQRDRLQARREVFVPRADLTVTELRALTRMRAEDRVIYGTKAANLGAIASAGLGIPVPAGFGVPFAFYVDHMKRNHLDEVVEKLLADPRFGTDIAWRKAALEDLRARIREAPIDRRALALVHTRVRKELRGKGVFVRSSTNAEDLEGFNGAGLYDTVPNVKGKKALGEALKRVWSSIWNLHAVEERSLFNIDHRACASGVLIQVGVDATAAGVLISKHLYDPEDTRSYTINAKRGLGLRVVGGTTIPEQIIYDTGNFGTKIISRSDDPTMLVFDREGGVREVPNPNRGVILTEARARALSETVMRFVPLFSSKYPLDVEWVLEGDKVWIVQARPYVSGP
jgi:phosphoenolpyruvate synthase/pyruvate phosphate dikinase